MDIENYIFIIHFLFNFHAYDIQLREIIINEFFTIYYKFYELLTHLLFGSEIVGYPFIEDENSIKTISTRYISIYRI